MSPLARRLLLAIFGLLALLQTSMLTLGVTAAVSFSDELTQALARSTAMYIAGKGELIVEGKVADASLRTWSEQARVLNPAAEVFLLDGFGNVLWPLGQGLLATPRVSLEPIRRFLNDPEAGGPIYGDDPRHFDKRRVFSAAAVGHAGVPLGYVYVLLGGGPQSGLLATIGSSYILKVALATVLVALLLGAFATWSVTHWLTRPMTKLHTRIVSAGVAVGLARAAPAAKRSPDLEEVAAVYSALECRVNAQLAQLQTVDRQRRELFAHISHDLRTPLTAMRGYLETLLSDPASLPVARGTQFVRIATRHCERLQRLVDRLFLLARLDAASTPLSPEPVAVTELVQDVVSKWRLPAETAGVSLRIEICPEAPSVSADIGLLETVLENLLDNAIRHCSKGGDVHVAVSAMANQVSVTIRDSGAGIAPQDLERLQQPFVAGPGGRTGLGLAIVRKVLELHGSALCIESRLGEGTKVGFSLSAEVLSREDSVISPQVSWPGAANVGRRLTQI